MKKRGISPLIATVLVIGFTVALAALVMTWSGGLFGGLTTSAELDTEFNLKCTKLANFNIDADYDYYGIRTTIQNNNNELVEGFVFSVYKDDKKVNVLSDLTINKFERKLYPVPVPSGFLGTDEVPDQISIRPKVKLSNDEIRTCAGEKEKTSVGIAGDNPVGFADSIQYQISLTTSLIPGGLEIIFEGGAYPRGNKGTYILIINIAGVEENPLIIFTARSVGDENEVIGYPTKIILEGTEILIKSLVGKAANDDLIKGHVVATIFYGGEVYEEIFTLEIVEQP